MAIIATLSANNNTRGFFHDYWREEREKIAMKTVDWSVNYLSSLGIFDKIIVFVDSDYDKISYYKGTRTEINLRPAKGQYFLRLNDHMIYEETGLKDEDFLFSTHMDAFISKRHLEEIVSLRDKHSLIAATNHYQHACIPVALDGKEVPWWADHCLLCNVGWMRKHDLKFAWNPCFREVQDKYLKWAGCPIAIKGRKFVTLDNPSTERPEQGSGLSFDGFQEASLKIGILQRKGLLPESDIFRLPNGQRADADMMHLKSFFMQSELSHKGISNNIIVNAIILGRENEKKRLEGCEGKQYSHNHRMQLLEIKGTSLYNDVWDDEERKRFNELIDV